MWRGTKLVLGSLQLIFETIYGGGCHLPAKYVRTAESHGTRQQQIHPSKICFYVGNKVDSTNRCEALKDKNISDLSDVLYLTSRKFDVTYNRIVLPEILGNWNFWIIWNLCKKILIFSIFTFTFLEYYIWNILLLLI